MNILTEYPVTVKVENQYTESYAEDVIIKAVIPTVFIGNTNSYGSYSIYAVNLPEFFNVANSPIIGDAPLWMTSSISRGDLRAKDLANEKIYNLADLSLEKAFASNKTAAKYLKSTLYYISDGQLLSEDFEDIDDNPTYWWKFFANNPGRNDGSAGGNSSNFGVTAIGNGVGNFVNGTKLTAPTLPPQGTWTFEAWLNGSGTVYNELVWANGSPVDLSIISNRSSAPYMYCPNNGGEFYANTPIPSSGWYHLTLVRDGSMFRWFINGVMSGSGSVALNHPVLNPPYPGSHWPFLGPGFNGSMSDVKVYDYVKYSTSFIPKSRGVTTYLTNDIGSVSQSNNSINFSPDGNLVAISGSTGVVVKNIEDFTTVGSVFAGVSIGAAFSEDNSKIFIGSPLNNVAGAYSLYTGNQLLSLSKKQNPTYSSICGKVAFASSIEDPDFKITVYTATSLALVTTINIPKLAKSLQFSADGSELIVSFDSSLTPIKRYNTNDWSENTNRGDLTGISYNPSNTIAILS